MAKISRYFQFNFPLNKRIVKDLRLLTLHVGDLQVFGKAYYDQSIPYFSTDESRYSVEIESLKWNGTEVLDLFQVTQLDTILADIEEAAIQHASFLFNSEASAA